MTRNVKLTVDAKQFAQMVASGEVSHGDEVELVYDSAFGGEQTKTGEMFDIGMFDPIPAVEDRIVKNSRVESRETGRTVGELKTATVTVSQDRAIELVTEHTGGHDVDVCEGETVVQFWEGDWHGETVLPHA